MERSLFRLDGSRGMRALALVGVAVVAVSAAPQYAWAQTQEWQAREFETGVFGPDNGVDVVYWSDPNSNDEWVYVTGYRTLANGATVFATYKYSATFTDPGENDPVASVFYPPRETAKGTHRAVAIDIDPATGDVYVTGESNRVDDETGFDYVIIKYNKDLVVDNTWKANSLMNDGAIRWNNELFNSDDRPVDIALADESQVPSATNVVGITGTSYTGVFNGLDIKTIMLEADTGNYFAGWSSASQSNPRTRQGSAGGNDRPVGIRAYWIAGRLQSAEPVLHVVVAGTLSQVNGVQTNDDIWTTEYDINGNTTWEEVYNGPGNGDDVATAMDVEKFVPVVFVCGSTASAGADTDYIAVGYELGSNPPTTRAW